MYSRPKSKLESNDYDRWATMSPSDVALFRSFGRLIDVSGGGLLIGPSHEDGGIYYIHEVAGTFKMTTMEGYEYLINQEAASAHLEELYRINDEQWTLGQGGPFTPFEVPSHILKIDVSEDSMLFGRKWLYMKERGQFVVNRHSTAKYLHRLDEINRSIR